MIDSHRVRRELKKHIFQFPYAGRKMKSGGLSYGNGNYKQL